MYYYSIVEVEGDKLNQIGQHYSKFMDAFREQQKIKRMTRKAHRIYVYEHKHSECVWMPEWEEINLWDGQPTPYTKRKKK